MLILAGWLAGAWLLLIAYWCARLLQHARCQRREMSDALHRLRRLIELVEYSNDKLNGIRREVVNMAGELDKLTQDVAEIGTAVDSAIALLQGLKAALDAAGTDPAKLAALSAELDAKTEALAAAIVANTPPPPAA